MSMPAAPHRPVGAVLAAGALLPVLLLLGMPQPGRLVLALVLVAFLPGYAWMRLTSFTDPLLVAVLSVSSSLALTTSLSLGLFYAGLWSWRSGAVALGLLTICAGWAESRRERT